MSTSQNGYSANDRNLMRTYTVGQGRRVSLRKGPAGQLLAKWADWFDANVQDIDAGQLDDWGYAPRTIRGSSTQLSNHASGTAIDLNATRHPLAKVGTFTSTQVSTIHAGLAKFDGCIRWGGDYHGRKDEMHFEVVVSEAACAHQLTQLDEKDWFDMATMDDLKAAIREVLAEPLVRVPVSDRGAFTGDPDKVSVLNALTRDWNIDAVDNKKD